MTTITGDISKNGILVAAGVEFTIVTQEIGGKRTTSGSFTIRHDAKITVENADPSFSVAFHDGRTGQLYISRRVMDGVQEHFYVRILGL